MPSGARKRKAAAAKKKQGKSTPNTNLSATSSTQGDEDLKHHESDGDQNTDGEEGVRKSTGDVKNGDAQVEKEAGGVQVEGKSKSGVGFDKKKGDSSSNSSSSSSSSDSDDGPREAEKKIEIEENVPVDDSVSDEPIEVMHATPVAKSEDPLAECVSEVGEGNSLLLDEKVPTHSGASADSPITPDVVELEQKENGEAKLSSLDESAELPEATKDLAPEDKGEEKASPVEVAKELAPDGESARLAEVTTDLAPEDKDEENVTLIEAAKEVVPDEQSARLPEVAVELAPQGKDEETANSLKVAKELVTGDGKYENIDIPATSDATESAVNKNDEKLTLSYRAKRVDTTVDSGQSQACATSVVRADQSTSWKSCCGLFEAFTGTSR